MLLAAPFLVLLALLRLPLLLIGSAILLDANDFVKESVMFGKCSGPFLLAFLLVLASFAVEADNPLLRHRNSLLLSWRFPCRTSGDVLRWGRKMHAVVIGTLIGPGGTIIPLAGGC